MTRTRRKLIPGALLLLSLAVCTWALHLARGERKDTDIPTGQARSGEFLVFVQCRGNLVAAQLVQLSAPIDVKDLQIVWLVPDGSVVKKGQPVIRFDPSKSQQDLREKKVLLDQAKASLAQATADAKITADQDRLDVASAQYDRDKARLEASKKAIVSSMDGEKSTIDLGLATEKVKVQEATMQMHTASATAKIASQKRLYDEAQAEYDRAVHRLKQMELVSPLDGIVSYRQNRSNGWANAQPYKVGDHVSAGVPIAEVPELASLQMESKVDEVDRGKIGAHFEVILHLDAFPEKNIAAKVVAVSPLTEQDFTEYPPTRTFRAFSSPNVIDGSLRPGMNGSADIIQARLHDAIHVPAKAVFTEHGKPVTYIKEAGSFKRCPVKLIARNADEIAISGLPAGAIVALKDPGSTHE
jgi:HlyD family secretion protein